MKMQIGSRITNKRGHWADVTRTSRGASSAKADTAFGQIDDVRLTVTDPAADTCPVIQAFMEAWREGLPETEWRILVPLMVTVARSRSTPTVEKRSGLMAAGLAGPDVRPGLAQSGRPAPTSMPAPRFVRDRRHDAARLTAVDSGAHQQPGLCGGRRRQRSRLGQGVG